MKRLLQILKDWMLIVAMLLGASMYIIYREADVLHPYGAAGLAFVKVAQPVMLFTMLFLSFCRIKPSDLKLKGWMWWLLLAQGLLFVAPTLGFMLLGGFSGAMSDMRVSVEAFTLCMICPTATACSVLTAKLGGDRAAVMTYTILINLLVAILVPAVVPLVHPGANMDFAEDFLLIISKVFPMLIMPCLLAWVVRYLTPKLHRMLLDYTELAFTVWAVSLTFAILMSVRAIYHSGAGVATLGFIALASLVSCAFQFWFGKRVGNAPCFANRDDAGFNAERRVNSLTAGQVMGQKNTVFAIWMGYTFLDPLSSVAGGFYSIWHNVFNSWQLYRQRKATSPADKL